MSGGGVMSCKVIALSLVLILPSIVVAQDCIDYGNYIGWVGGLQLDWLDFEVEASGDYAYILGGSLKVIDLTNPEGPQITGFVELPYYARNLAVSGNFAYAAEYGFHVIDISDPQNPWIASNIEFPGIAGDVVVAGSFAYVATDSAGLLVVDISEPGNPFLTGSLDTPNPVFGVAVAGSYAYATAGSEGLQVIDISDPQNPFVFRSVDALGSTGRVIISGDNAYVTAGFDGLLVFDITDPENPQIISVVEVPDQVRDVAVSGGKAFVTYSGDYNSGGSMFVVDITNPEFPEIIRNVETPLGASRLVVSGNHALVLGPYRGDCLLLVLGISGSADFPTVFSVDTPGSAEGVAASGDYVFIADGEAGLQVIDPSMTGQQNPVIGTVALPGLAGDVDISDTHAYILCGASLQIVDVSDPTDPLHEGNLEILGYLSDLAVSFPYAYVVEWDTGLYIIDITSPANPLIVGNVDTPGGGDFGGANSLAVSGNYAYVTDAFGLHIIDITIGENPQILGTVEGGFFGVSVSGNYAYVLEPVNIFGYGAILHTIETSGPTAPMITGSVTIPSGGDVVVSGDYAYVAGGFFGLQLVKISDPTRPQLVSGGLNMSGMAVDLAVSGDYAYVAAYDSGLHVLPSQCESTVSIEGNPEDTIRDEEVPSAGLGLAVHPNPFNPQTTISFSLQHSEWAEIGVYDLGGRLLRVLANQTYDTGHHSVAWQGKDFLGRAVPSGSYIIRLKTESGVQTSKVSLIR
jgi:hypothetical protein